MVFDEYFSPFFGSEWFLILACSAQAWILSGRPSFTGILFLVPGFCGEVFNFPNSVNLLGDWILSNALLHVSAESCDVNYHFWESRCKDAMWLCLGKSLTFLSLVKNSESESETTAHRLQLGSGNGFHGFESAMSIPVEATRWIRREAARSTGNLSSNFWKRFVRWFATAWLH